MLHSAYKQIWKTQQCPRDWKRSVFIPVAILCNAKECSNYHKIALISHASKVMLKILQARFQHYVKSELPEVLLDLEKAEEPEVNLPTFVRSLRSKRIKEKHLFLLYWLCQSLWLCGSQKNCGKFFKNGNTRLPDLLPEKSVCRSEATVRTGHGKTDWFKIGKGVYQACILSPCLFNL